MPPTALPSRPAVSRRAPRALAAALACAAATAAQAAGTLTVCTPGAPDGFDIAQYETLNTADATQGLYDQLLSFKPGTSEIAPGLAERWQVSPDGRTVTLFLRRGVKFHTTAWFTPTRDFNADDVLWSIQRVNDKSHPAHGAARNGYIYWAGMNMPALIESVAKVDDHTVKIGAHATRGALPRQPGDVGDRLGLLGRVRQPAAEGRPARPAQHAADRHRPLRLPRLPEGRRDPLRRASGVLARRAQGRQPGLRDHRRPQRARAAREAPGSAWSAST